MRINAPMENQHRKISGYRDLTHAEIDLMNEVKCVGPAMDKLIQKLQDHISKQVESYGESHEFDQHRLMNAEPARWIAIGRTHLQEGLMALTRAIAQPTFF
jgi:hypothetical protein